ncbi:MCE family protein [Nocardioides nanhaiensis]|uniref:MCE family protein n=1 Tax=Nocardioides nanhaiensis TaxID=1476871 RepID=A0ABP8WIZ5_9ACTN
MNARSLLAGLLCTVLALATGCSTTLADVPLSGTGVPGETVSVSADFEEALNLSRGATVKVNGVDSGRVQEVTAADFQARAEMLVRADAGLREGATARLRYTTPLGELFVDVTNPERGPVLEDGAVLPISATDTAPTVEDALSQASLLVNGGGLAQLQTVTEELNLALGGREARVRSLLEGSATLVSQTNATTAEIDRTLRALASVSRTLRSRERTIDRALRDIAPAARVLRANTPGFTRLLREVEQFAEVADQTVGLTREQLLGLTRQAGPVLGEFAALQDDYARGLDELVRLGSALDGVVPGDYLSIALDLHLDGLQPPDLAQVLEDLLGLPLPELGLDDLGLPILEGPGPLQDLGRGLLDGLGATTRDLQERTASVAGRRAR